ncbi:MAG: hypothetical protein HYZ42_11280 [Bacteroidetes bacterium]|nr:hypothetical protein [Bacteroidota bacterium]
MTGFTIAHGLLSFLTVGNRQLYDTASIINYNYWGYAFKRPPVFNEILNADKVLTCTPISNIYLDSAGIKPFHVVIDTTKSMDNLYGRKDFYYGISDRIFMVFQDRAHLNGYLYDFPKIYNNPDLKASKNILKSLERQILETNLIDIGATPGQLNGIVTELLTVDKANYIFVGLHGGEVSNDHYPHYEFLFAEKDHLYKLVKKQRFYTDVAGIEGLEYANIAPFFSLLLTVIGLVGAIIIGTTNRIIKSRKQTNVIV